MKSPRVRVLSLLLMGAVLPCLPAGAGQYGETFDAFLIGATTLSPAGTLYSNQVSSTAAVAGASKELRLTAELKTATNSAFLLPDLDPGKRVMAFSAKWNTPVTGSLTRNFGLADGFSLNFGALSSIPTSAYQKDLHTGGTFRHEYGFDVGLAVGVVTYRDPAPGYVVRVNGVAVPNGFVPKASADWGTANTKRHFFEVDWHYIDGLTLRVDGETIFAGLPTPGFVPQVGDRFGFGARTGSGTQEVALDNVSIITDGVLARIPAASPYFSSLETPPLQTAAMAFDNNASSKWVAAAASGHIGASFPVAKTIRLYTFTGGDDLPARDPKNWAFESSVDGIAWTSRGTWATQYFLNRGERRSLVVTTPLAGNAFRMNITGNNGDASTQLAEFEPWEMVPGPATLTVTNLSDSGAGSLRQALADAAAAPGDDVILFGPGLGGGTISLSSTLEVSDSSDVMIDAIPVGGITLSGAAGVRILSNAGTGALGIRRVHFANGSGGAAGGGGLAAGVGTTTTLTSCHFHGCNGQGGGALSNKGTLTMDGCTFSANSSDAEGGAVLNEGTMALTACTLTGNTARLAGGAIRNFNGSLSLKRCTISGNSSPESPCGGISHSASGPSNNATFALTDSIVTGSAAAGPSCDILADGETASITRAGANIVGLEVFSNSASGTGPAVIVVDPLLAPLGSYGGPVPTMALALGSPALNAASAVSSIADQRGFPVVGLPDIGAYEAGTYTFASYDTWIWEKLPPSATVAQHDRSFDFDGDGHTNGQEFLSLNSPADGGNYLRIATYSTSPTTFSLSYPTIFGRTYILQQSVDLVTWTNVQTTTNGVPQTSSFSMATIKKQYFRLVVKE